MVLRIRISGWNLEWVMLVRKSNGWRLRRLAVFSLFSGQIHQQLCRNKLFEWYLYIIWYYHDTLEVVKRRATTGKFLHFLFSVLRSATSTYVKLLQDLAATILTQIREFLLSAVARDLLCKKFNLIIQSSLMSVCLSVP